MSVIAKGGQNVYGVDIGILMLESSFPRIEGDIGNAKTWDFPVMYKIVKGGTPQKVVLDLTLEDIEPFIDAALELEKCGVKAITTSCGFLALFQQELNTRLSIPVFTSALMFVPMLHQLSGGKSKVGILTANKKTLTQKHLASVGITPDMCKIVGLEDKEVFTNFTVQNWDSVDVDACKKELLEAARELVEEEEISAVVLECTNMSPYAKIIQEELGLPVFDIVLLTNMFYKAFNPTGFLCR